MASGGRRREMDKRLLQAATNGNVKLMKDMASQDPSILLGTTPAGNTCLHISCIHEHRTFCRHVLELEESLLSKVNHEGETSSAAINAANDNWSSKDYQESLLSKFNRLGETPLLIAVTLRQDYLASFLLGRCRERGLRQAILQKDRFGSNALHHAIRYGQERLALELIAKEPALSQAVTKYNESPMLIAVMRNFTDISLKLLSIPDSSHVGQYGRHALHAAARNGNRVVAEKIMVTRPQLAKEADQDGITPIRMAVSNNKVDVLQVLLEYDSSLGYEIDKHGDPLLCSAATRGQVAVARALLDYCPDAFYCPVIGDGPVIGESSVNGHILTCLHIAVSNGRSEFVKFILQTQQLRKLINMQDNDGRTALHYAVQQCDPRLVAALLSHEAIDTTILDNRGTSAACQLASITNDDNTLDWKEVHELMLKVDPQNDDISLNLRKEAKQRETIESKRKSLTQKYTNNTSLVAILLATITFTAAFTLPGGYSSDTGSEGLPIMSRNIAFQAFLVSDTLAMCSSFVVAFICLMGKWEDDKFTTHYIFVTKMLTWFAYMATITAFSTGLYTVLAPRVHWLAIGICSVVGLLPILTMFIATWPVLELNFRLLKTVHEVLKLKFKSRQGYRSNQHGIV